jgi:putative copper export protein
VSLPSLLAGLVRGLELAGLAVIIGGLALERLRLPAAASNERRGGQRLRRMITGGVLVLALATCVDLGLRAQTVSRAPLATAIASIPQLVTHTHFGALLAARLAMLGLTLILSLARGTLARALCLLIALAVALTFSLTGHAADWGDLTASVAVDWAHAVAASAWTGGLLALALVVLRPNTEREGGASPSFAALASRFSRLAGWCLLIVLLTGAFNAWTQLGAVSRLWTTTYGRVLIAKVLVVAALVWLGAINRYVVIPRLDQRAARGWAERAFRLSRLVVRGSRGARRPVSASSQLARYVAGEAGLVVAVFACTAALGETTPGRHVSFERKPTSHVTNIQPRASVDRSRPGTVTPPAGDAARGRDVFVRLKCFTCHAVDGERFPPATRPGPNLSDAGRHPAGNLIESILNPNAMVVDGPGYTDDRGLSIMPEYRQTMTVGDLVDLVSYLKDLGAPSRAPDPRPSP